MGIKLAIIVRTDLKMGKGKIAAQAGHASVMASARPHPAEPGWLSQWLGSGQKKIVLKVPGPAELEDAKRRAFEAGLPCCEVRDAGHTQVEPGTATCISIGPAPEERIDAVAGSLKLL